MSLTLSVAAKIHNRLGKQYWHTAAVGSGHRGNPQNLAAIHHSFMENRKHAFVTNWFALLADSATEVATVASHASKPTAQIRKKREERLGEP
jgi:hypothetical protein